MAEKNPGLGATSTGAGIDGQQHLVDTRPTTKPQAFRDRSRITDLRDEMFRRDLVRLHALGPRAYYEMLAELGAQRLIRTEIEAIVRQYSRIDPARVAAAGGDQWPPR